MKQLNTQAMEKALGHIVQNLGISCLKDSKRFSSAVADFLPGFEYEAERKALCACICDEVSENIINAASNSQSEKQRVLNSCVKYLTSQRKLTEQQANELVKVFTHVLWKEASSNTDNIVVKHTPQTFFAKTKKEAESGDAEAQNILAGCYFTGKGVVRQNYTEAAKWYRKAAEQGHAEAQAKVNAIEQELKEQEERKKADEKLADLRKAAEDGDTEAQYILNVCNDNQPFDEDIDKAFNLYNQRKERIRNIVVEIKTLLKRVYLPQQCTVASELDRLEDKLNNDVFRVATIGSYLSGKSTCVEAMLGEEIFPRHLTPSKEVINEVKYSKHKKSVLIFLDPIPDNGWLCPNDVLDHVKHYYGQAIPPMEVPYNIFDDYVNMEANPGAFDMVYPYSRVRLYYPLDILSRGVEFIECPSIDNYGGSGKTKDFLHDLQISHNLGAILFVLTADKLCSQFDMDFLENELKDFTGSIFFVVNRFDLIRKESDRDRVKQFVNLKLQNLSSRGIYYVSASQALKAKENGDPVLLHQSGIAKLERELYNFLVLKKAKKRCTHT